MARRVAPPSDELEERSNPSLFGEDIIPLAWLAGGAAGSAYLNAKLVSPFTAKFVPGSSSNATAAQVVDGATTGAVGYAAGWLIGKLSRPVGAQVRRGGVVMGLAKVMAAFIPNFSLSSEFPDFLGMLSRQNASTKALPASDTKALPAGSIGQEELATQVSAASINQMGL